jgi:hypothetical protein
MLDYMHSIQHLLLIIAHDLNQDLDSIITRKGRFSAVNEMDRIIAIAYNRALRDQRQTKGSCFLRRSIMDGDHCQRRKYNSFSSRQPGFLSGRIFSSVEGSVVNIRFILCLPKVVGSGRFPNGTSVFYKGKEVLQMKELSKLVVISMKSVNHTADSIIAVRGNANNNFTSYFGRGNKSVQQQQETGGAGIARTRGSVELCSRVC